MIMLYHHRKWKHSSEADQAVHLGDASSATWSEGHTTVLSMHRRKFYLQGQCRSGLH